MSLFDDQRAAAAEYLRGFGKGGDSLESCWKRATERAETKEAVERARVAGELLGLT